MKIRFDIDGTNKKIGLYFRHKDFEDAIIKYRKDNPTKHGDKLVNPLARGMTEVVARSIEKLGKIIGQNLLEYKLKFKIYKHESEIPIRLREVSLN